MTVREDHIHEGHRVLIDFYAALEQMGHVDRLHPVLASPGPVGRDHAMTYRVNVELERERVKPAAWRAALDLADGDEYRLVVLKDGSIVIANSPQHRRLFV